MRWNLTIGRSRLLMGTVVPPNPAGKAAVASHLCVGLSLIFFYYLFREESWLTPGLFREDEWVENLTAVYWFLAGLSLFAAALERQDPFYRRLYVIGGAVMVFLCGEEISWGQRILGFLPPDPMLDFYRRNGFPLLNDFSLHSTGIVPMETIGYFGILLLFVTAVAAFLGGKDRLFGIPLPSIPLTFCFLLLLVLRPGAARHAAFLFFAFSLSFCALVIAFFYRKQELLIAAIGNAVFVPVAAIFARVWWGQVAEVYEYFFALICLFYALELRLRTPGRPSAAPRGILFPPAIPSPVVVWTSAIAGCIVSILFAYYATRVTMEAARVEAHRLIESSKPAIRSFFDVYVDGDRVVYVREPCIREDTEPWFFLHLHPADPDDLPFRRRGHGFDNHDFVFGVAWSSLSDGKCLVTRPLPGYEIAEIHTGQYVPEDEDWIWMESIGPLFAGHLRSVQLGSMTVGEYLGDRVGDREPAIRSDFDVHLVANTLIYVREQCGRADVDAPFFLHVDAADPDDLPDDRRRYGFDNLDFRFDARGVQVGATCVAEVALPEYDVAAIRTGQVVTEREGGHRRWVGEIRFGAGR